MDEWAAIRAAFERGDWRELICWAVAFVLVGGGLLAALCVLMVFGWGWEP